MKKAISILLCIIMSVIIISSNSTKADEMSSFIHKNGIVIGTEGEGADVNEELELPEKGWTRYDDTNAMIEYSGFYRQLYYNEYYSETLSYLWKKGSEMKFTVEGSSFRILTGTVPSNECITGNEYEKFKCKLYIDGEYVGAKNHTSSRLEYPTGNKIEFDYEFDEPGTHEVKLVMSTDKDEVHIDAIDVIGKIVSDKVKFDDKGNILSPLYRYYRSDNDSYHYNFRNVESINAGHFNEGEIIYVYDYKVEGAIPLYEYITVSDERFHYTVDKTIYNEGDSEYDYVGIKCYIRP